MFDIELVVVTNPEATKTDEGMYRFTERVANLEIARTTVDALARKLTGEDILTINAAVVDGGHPVNFTYMLPGGDIVGFVNINEVVGE